MLQMVLIWTVAFVVFVLIAVSSTVALVVRTTRRGAAAVTRVVSGGRLRLAGLQIRAHLTSMAFAFVGWTLLDVAYYGFPTSGTPSWADRVLHATIAVGGLIAFRLSEHLWSLLRPVGPPAVPDCHHCDEPTVSGHCWWCGGPAPRFRP
ncbi:MAG TPA: hypothetical protein VFP27_06205 [Mycobacterium sp.]|nr:hypothetical protein [Mycobacterium sp.]